MEKLLGISRRGCKRETKRERREREIRNWAAKVESLPDGELKKNLVRMAYQPGGFVDQLDELDKLG